MTSTSERPYVAKMMKATLQRADARKPDRPQPWKPRLAWQDRPMPRIARLER